MDRFMRAGLMIFGITFLMGSSMIFLISSKPVATFIWIIVSMMAIIVSYVSAEFKNNG